MSIEEAETSTDDNYAELALGLSDLLLYDVTNTYNNGEVYLNCKVKNIGYSIANDIHLYAYNQGEIGTLVYESVLDDLAYNEEIEVSFVLPSNYCASIYDEELCSIELSVNCCNLEESNYNNEFVFVYDNLLPFEFEIDSFEEGITITKYTGTSSTVSIPSMIGGAEVTTISPNVFNNTAAEEICIAASVTSIAANAFVGANTLKNIVVDDNNANYQSVDGILYNKSTSSLLAYPSEKVVDPNFKVPKGVTTIGKYAFYGNKNVVNLDTTGIVTIDDYAFNHSSLSVCNFADTTKTVGSYAFANTANLTQVNTNQIVTIKSYAFYNSALNECTIGAPVTSIGRKAFYCPTIKNVKFNAIHCTYLNSSGIGGQMCFSDAVDTITIGENVTYVPQYIFRGTSISEIDLPENVKSIDSYAFSNCSNLRSFDFKNCGSISEYVLSGCTALETVVIPDHVSTIGQRAFSGCTSLSEIELPESLTTLGSHAFNGCTALSEVVIPKNTTTLSNNVFSGCTNLQQLTIPRTVVAIGDSLTEATTTIQCYTNSSAHVYAVENNIPFTLLRTPGDVSGNGVIDLKDITLLSRYLAGWTVSLDDKSADVNADGKLDLKDVVLIRRYLAGGWNVTLQ